MTAVTFGTHAHIKELKSAGFIEEHAEVHVHHRHSQAAFHALIYFHQRFATPIFSANQILISD
ncbi:MAG: hypothetical protein HQL07_19540 [Nitrospirae bacterium]|nr:hypothetical protein [Magnetococcales bacterium]